MIFAIFDFTGGVEIVGDPFTEGQQQKQEAGEQPAIHQIQFGPEDFLLMQNGQNCSGPTSSNVCVDNFPGAYNFSVNFTTLQNIKSKHWDVSTSVHIIEKSQCCHFKFFFFFLDSPCNVIFFYFSIPSH